MLVAARAHRPRSAGVWVVGSVPAPVLWSLLDFCLLGDWEQGYRRISDPTGRFQLCSRLCNVPQNCAGPRAPLPARGDPGLGGARGRSEERHTKGTQVQREPCHHAIKRRRKTISVIAKLVRSTGAILWLFKPTYGPITAWLESSKGKAAKCILLPVVSFTIF